MSKAPYSLAVGSLMYVMFCTRQYIAHAVGVVGRYINNPSTLRGSKVDSQVFERY